MDSNSKRDIILSHNSNPTNREIPSDSAYIKVNSSNESCIDNIDLYIKIENDMIKDIKFEGVACAISISSTSIMITNLIGKSITEALVYIKEFENMVDESEYNANILNEAVVYSDINKQQNRKVCALLPYVGIKKVLEANKNN